MANNTIECPADLVLINGRKARLTAGSVFILAVIYLFTFHWTIPVFLVLDFFARSFKLGRYSLLNFISDKLIQIFSIKPTPTDQAPKRFAAKVGLLFSIAMLVFFAFQLTFLSLIIALILATFALLESAFGFCAGCHVYSFYMKFLKKKAALYTVSFLVVCLSLFQSSMAQPAKPEAAFTIENYYKTKWGAADEFINLWKINHYPLLKKVIEKGDIISVVAAKPLLHSGEDTRWDFKVTIVFKNIEKAFDANLTEPYKKTIYPDIEKLKKDEQHRFELLLAHWDIPVEKVAVD